MKNFNKNKKKGYLMIDIATGAAIIAIFSLIIFSFFDNYLNMKNKKIYNQLDYSIIKEIEKNCDYDELCNLNLGNYIIDIKSLDEIKDLNIVESIKLNESKVDGKYFFNLIEKNENFVECEVLMKYEKIGFIKYRR